MDVLDRVRDLMASHTAQDVVDQVINTVRDEYGGSSQYVRVDRGVRIRQLLSDGVPDMEVQQRFHLTSRNSTYYHRRML